MRNALGPEAPINDRRSSSVICEPSSTARSRTATSHSFSESSSVPSISHSTPAGRVFTRILSSACSPYSPELAISNRPLSEATWIHRLSVEVEPSFRV